MIMPADLLDQALEMLLASAGLPVSLYKGTLIMEKQGVVRPGVTPEVEELANDKRASENDKVAALDNDFAKRAADKVAATLKPAVD